MTYLEMDSVGGDNYPQHACPSFWESNLKVSKKRLNSKSMELKVPVSINCNILGVDKYTSSHKVYLPSEMQWNF